MLLIPKKNEIIQGIKRENCKLESLHQREGSFRIAFPLLGKRGNPLQTVLLSIMASETKGVIGIKRE